MKILVLIPKETLYKWTKPYYSFSKNKNENKCNMYLINYLKELVYITDDEINNIFSEEYLGGAIDYGLELIKNNYNCSDRCDEKYYLNKSILDSDYNIKCIFSF